MDAVEDALRLIGGDALLGVVTQVYEAIHKAELRGTQDGFSEGHRIGLIDGRAQVEREVFGEETAKVNAWVEGADITVLDDPDWTHPVDHADEQPSDEGLAGLSETF